MLRRTWHCVVCQLVVCAQAANCRSSSASPISRVPRAAWSRRLAARRRKSLNWCGCVDACRCAHAFCVAQAVEVREKLDVARLQLRVRRRLALQGGGTTDDVMCVIVCACACVSAVDAYRSGSPAGAPAPNADAVGTPATAAAAAGANTSADVARAMRELDEQLVSISDLFNKCERARVLSCACDVQSADTRRSFACSICSSPSFTARDTATRRCAAGCGNR
jgi:hypothetical protein